MRDQKTSNSQASWALLMEGVSSARLETHRIRQLMNRALRAIETSPQKDEIYQRVGDVVVALPNRLTRLDNLLDRTSYALALMGKESIHSRLPLGDRNLVEDVLDSVPILPPIDPARKNAGYTKQPSDLAGVRTFVDETSTKNLPSTPVDQAIGAPSSPGVEYFGRPEMNKGKPETTRLMPQPGEQYGVPWKEEVTQRRTMEAVSPEKIAEMYMDAKRQRKTRGKARTDGMKARKKQRRENPGKVKEKARKDKVRRRKTKNKRKIQDAKRRKNPQQHKRVAALFLSSK